MNTEYAGDSKEMVALIHAAIPAGQTGDFHACLARLTQELPDEFLLGRAKYLLEESSSDEAFSSALGKLAAICNDKKRRCAVCPVSKYCSAYIAHARNTVDMAAPTTVDLFCGAGGLSLGFTQAGYRTVAANDIEPCCIDTYAHNHPEMPRENIVLGDINLVMDELENRVGLQVIDVLTGGPPCQGFSMANRQRLIDDPRNRLYKSYVQFLGRLQPRFFVMENVKGMLSVAGQVTEDLRAVGYTVSAKILNAKDFGIPQNRERLIFIGNRVGRDNDGILKRIEELGAGLPHTVLADALYGLAPLSASRIKNATDAESTECGRVIAPGTGMVNDYIDAINMGLPVPVVLNHKARYNNDRDIEIFRRLEPGDRSDDPKIADIMPYARRNGIFKDKYFKLEPDKVCKTITAHMKFDCNMYIHPTQARGLTPREAARVQSFPDDYFFRGAYTKTYMQIGNSVPPMLGRVIAQAISEQL